MEQSKIDRINEFARRVKAGETLTTEEQAERPPCAGNISTASRPTWQPNWTAPILWSRTALSTSCPKSHPDCKNSIAGAVKLLRQCLFST